MDGNGILQISICRKAFVRLYLGLERSGIANIRTKFNSVPIVSADTIIVVHYIATQVEMSRNYSIGFVLFTTITIVATCTWVKYAVEAFAGRCRTWLIVVIDEIVLFVIISVLAT